LLGRVRVADKFPDVKARMQPSARNLRFRSACDCVGRDSLAPFDRGFGSPRRRPTSWGRRLFCRQSRRPVRAPA